MADLVHGKYSVFNPFCGILGGAVNALDPSVPAFSNASYLGLSGLTDSSAALTSGKATVVAVPVDNGALISKISMPLGATAPTTTHGWVAIYSGTSTPTLAVQSTDIGSSAPSASGMWTVTLPAPVLVSNTLTASTTTATAVAAPYGYIYVAISETGTPNSFATVSAATAVSYQWTGLQTTATTPLFFGAAAGSALGATAANTVASPTAQAACPIVILQ